MVATAAKVETRDSVLDACERLMGRLGYQKMTMEDVAAEAGISKRALYLHFQGKEDIAISTIDRIAGRCVYSLEEIARSPRPADEKIREMLAARVLVRVDAVRDYFLTLDEIMSTLRRQYMERREEYFEREAEVFAKVLRDGFKVSDDKKTARAMLDATNSLLPNSLTVRELGKRAQIEAQVREIADLIVNGLERK